ncbi:hypothetical protein D9757_007543 [Collybiopsis confluens]|uniref:Heparinase II/III family protein n=1 Tax=Collybiopsis confluens TaxID=2823264 RepID=A0A8H5HEM8_9AGAR|nr:hypothetical protein D9757_007543 [Collybiopsis confluens]
MGTSLTDSQLRALSECVANGRLGNSIIYATSTLFMYDYLLTVWDEAKYVWRPRKVTISSVAFFLARYGAMAGAIASLLPGSNSVPAIANTTTVLRLLSIVASEFIIAVRTWAIWGRSRRILWTLAFFSVAAIIPAAIIVGEDVASSRVKALISEEFIDICSLTTSKIDQGFVVPYVLTILYELVTLTLSLIRIIRWRRTIPKNIRAPIIDNLWRDGVLYFSFMLGPPDTKRRFPHLAGSKDSRDITAPGSSVYRPSTGLQLTTQFVEPDAAMYALGDLYEGGVRDKLFDVVGYRDGARRGSVTSCLMNCVLLGIGMGAPGGGTVTVLLFLLRNGEKSLDRIPRVFRMAYHQANNNSTQNLNNPYGASDPYYNQSTGYISPPAMNEKRRSQGVSNWIKFGVPVAILVIIGVVVGAVVGTRQSSSSSSNPQAKAAASASASSASVNAALEELATGKFAMATNSLYMVPLYPQVTDTAVFVSPTFASSAKASLTWPSDPFSAATPVVTNVRPDRPRLIAPMYKWNVLADHIKADPYLSYWNETIFGNATDWYNADPIPYFDDQGNGILDPARQFKQRAKAFSYAYRMTNNTKWVDRLWNEIKNVAGNNTGGWGPDQDKWNSIHFLDTAELSAGYGIAYDWLHDVWSDEQKAAMRTTLIEYGLSFGVNAATNGTIGWWRTNVTGNWNCVCNGGLTLAALAILGDDDTGTASNILSMTVDNALANCAGGQQAMEHGVKPRITGYAEMVSALITATGGSYGMLNDAYKLAGYSHMYGQGQTQMFAVGDTGPNKFSATANSMFLFSEQFNDPVLALYQRDQFDAADPWSMFWYDASVQGAFWDGLPLDRNFDNEIDQWVSMRDTWTDINGTYVGMKAGMNQGRQTHNDLDCGDFVIDAMGHRWAGELGDGNYNALDYFSNDTQGSGRWMYYRKMTEGQNTILVNKGNQDVSARPTILGYGSTNDTQGSSTIYDVASGSTAYWYANITSAYFDTSSLLRGVRFINNRTQVLVQDEITTAQSFQWRMHTNATVDVSSDGKSATLTIDGDQMIVSILSPSSGAQFTTSDAVRFPSDPTPPEPDQPNDGVKVLIIELDAGTYNLQVLFSPQWKNGASSVTPPSVDLTNWSLTSHN